SENPPHPLTKEDRATLIAYLDGELEEEAARQMEVRLSQEPAVRAEAEVLKRTWDLLDYLPKVEASSHFTHRTLAQVTSRQKIYRLGRLWIQRVAWAAGVLVALALGYAGVMALVPRHPTDEELVRDLRLIENKRLYEEAGSVEFLRELDQPDLF